MKLEQVQIRSVKYVMGTLKSPYEDSLTISGGIETLTGCPDICDDGFECYAPTIKNLVGGPSEIYGHVTINFTSIVDLHGAPKIVRGGGFNCSCNKLKTLDGLLIEIDGAFRCTHNDLKSLHMIHKKIKVMKGGFFAEENTGLEKDLLGLLLIPGLTHVDLDNKKLTAIINKHLKTPNRKISMLQCQQELIEAGFEEAAQL